MHPRHLSSPETNLLVEALPPEDREMLLGCLERVELPLGTELFAPHRAPRFVHFLVSGLASNVITLSAGQGVEVGVSAHRGFPEVLHLLGPGQCCSRCFIQVAGAALRMEIREFRTRFLPRPAVAARVLEYAQYRSALSHQLIVCNTLHTVEQRTARWLLQSADSLERNVLALTQEFLANMLGSTRSTVTLVTGALERRGLIAHRRGTYELLDREGLERGTCECYGMMRDLQRGLYQAPAVPYGLAASPVAGNGYHR